MKASLDIEPFNTNESTNINLILIQTTTPLEQLQTIPIQPSSSSSDENKNHGLVNYEILTSSDDDDDDDCFNKAKKTKKINDQFYNHIKKKSLA